MDAGLEGVGASCMEVTRNTHALSSDLCVCLFPAWCFVWGLQKQKQRLDARHHEPLFTNITKDFKGTLDYVLYTQSSLQPTAVLVRGDGGAAWGGGGAGEETAGGRGVVRRSRGGGMGGGCGKGEG